MTPHWFAYYRGFLLCLIIKRTAKLNGNIVIRKAGVGIIEVSGVVESVFEVFGIVAIVVGSVVSGSEVIGIVVLGVLLSVGS